MKFHIFQRSIPLINCSNISVEFSFFIFFIRLELQSFKFLLVLLLTNPPNYLVFKILHCLIECSPSIFKELEHFIRLNELQSIRNLTSFSYF
mmetsp:Transcript_1793/g.1715  ORF Transcript_1793/g.1715 Transcript_1793/m.1715 type:complete len:92 (-) Transcript_1793:3368-3643(-)